MTISSLMNAADSLRDKYSMDDPAEVCRLAGVILLYFPMGCSRAACKGFILRQAGCTAITVNSDIGPDMQRIVIFHELAHYFLHIRTGLAETMQDFAVGSPASDMEYEADMLAAEISLDDGEVLSALNNSNDFFEAAELLHTIPEMLEFKLRFLRTRGYVIPDAPIISSAGFLGRRCSPA